jgi:putative peptidoglycan lipid II flippase
LKAGPLLDGLSKVPGLHLALGMASASASYINLLLLWRWLRQADIYQQQAGWGRHVTRLALACGAMIVVLLLGRWYWPDWTQMQVIGRVWRLALLVCAGGVTYVVVLFATGFRLRELQHD